MCIRDRIFIIGVLFVMISSLFAHSAKDVTASFDNETKLLKVDFTHKVSDESKHFIFLVKVLSLIHISEPTRPLYISYAVFCLKKKKKKMQNQKTLQAHRMPPPYK
eukprot:TRINITY_DN28656_c0_g1_i1.p2 TRINITY_DN28656_c0_g1~~TRINITY_DN28656_c0_g1_i1.p2  ORF type:complete len:106 (-),score=18.58 TRINITY_DN28656_c0_g1_i1:76-393(-)